MNSEEGMMAVDFSLPIGLVQTLAGDARSGGVALTEVMQAAMTSFVERPEPERRRILHSILEGHNDNAISISQFRRAKQLVKEARRSPGASAARELIEAMEIVTHCPDATREQAEAAEGMGLPVDYQPPVNG